MVVVVMELCFGAAQMVVVVEVVMQVESMCFGAAQVAVLEVATQVESRVVE